MDLCYATVVRRSGRAFKRRQRTPRF